MKKSKKTKKPTDFSGVIILFLIFYFVFAGRLLISYQHSSTLLKIICYIFAWLPLPIMLYLGYKRRTISEYSYRVKFLKAVYKTIGYIPRPGGALGFRSGDYFDFLEDMTNDYLKQHYQNILRHEIEEEKRRFPQEKTVKSICTLVYYRNHILDHWSEFDGIEISICGYYCVPDSSYITFLRPIRTYIEDSLFGQIQRFCLPSFTIEVDDKYLTSDRFILNFVGENVADELTKVLDDDKHCYKYSDAITAEFEVKPAAHFRLKGNLRKDENNRFYLDNAQRVG